MQGRRDSGRRGLRQAALLLLVVATMLTPGVPTGSRGPSESPSPMGAEVVPAPASHGPSLASAGSIHPFTTGPPPNWRNFSTTNGITPPPNEGGGLAYDAHSGYVVWVGGSDLGISETFTFTNGSWSNLTGSLTGSPPAVPGGMVAADPSLDAVLLVGAFLGSATLGTWAFANGSWTNLTPTVGPGPSFREDGSLSYDPATDQVVLFGGLGIGVGLSDTWTFNGVAWTQAAPSSHPPPRWAAGLAFDGADNALLLEGGVYGNTYENDTWTWSGSTWTEIAGARAPAGLSLSRDALAEAPGGEVVGFGALGCGSSFGVCNRTYEFANGVWSAIASQNAPPPILGLQLVYDGRDGYDLAFGGEVAVGEGSAASWALGGPVVAWLTVNPPVAQPPMEGQFATTARGGYGVYSYVYTGTHLDCVTANVSTLPCLLDLDDYGNSTVTVQVTDQEGNTSSADAEFSVLLPLYAYDDISAFVADVGQAINFSIVVDPPSIGVNFTWSGLPPECPFTYVRNFTCTMDRSGFYGIDCLVVDSFGASFLTETYSLNVSERPSILAWPDRTSGNAPLDVQFDSVLTGGTVPFTYVWSFGDGGTSSLPDPVHTYTTTGSFDVSLSVADGAGVVTNWTGHLAIEVGATLGAVISDQATVWQAPAQVSLSAIVTGGVAPYTFLWDLGNGATSTLQNLTANYTTPGAYTLRVTVTDHDGLVASTSTVIAVLPGSGTSTGSSGGIPLWALGAVGALALVGGLVAGVWYGNDRRLRFEPPAPPSKPNYRED